MPRSSERRRRAPYKRAALALATAAAIGAGVTLLLPRPGGELAGPYTSPRYMVAFGEYSHWLQPWRSYMETMPASTFVDGIGMNFNVGAENADLVAEMLARHGVKRVRIEIGWGTIDFGDESRLAPGFESVAAVVRAAARHGLRPLILLNSNEGRPCPLTEFARVTPTGAAAGATTLALDSTDGIVAGYSGLSNVSPAGRRAAEILVTGVDGNTVTLSKPLPHPIAPGTSLPMATLKYRPFSAPATPEYQQTLAGWKRYVANVAAFVRGVLGTGGQRDKGFDLEIWNELTFGSAFLSVNNYYSPAYQDYDEEKIRDDLVRATSEVIDADPDGFSGVVVGNGFSNTIPWPASSTLPARVTALSRHPYPPRLRFPADEAGPRHPGWVAVDARGGRERRARFRPRYSALLPEFGATLLGTETFVRDMSPLTNSIYGVRHGRDARVVDGRVVPTTTWITELNVSPAQDDPRVSRQAALNMKARASTRALAFYLNKGVTQLDLFAAQDSDRGLGIVQDNFLAYAAGRPAAAYPRDDRPYTSPALAAIGRMSRLMRSGLDRSLSPASTRRIVVTGISDHHDHRQFDGDGTPAHPPLYDRELLAILPFQVNGSRFVIPYYVMTHDIAKPLEPERFTVSLRGIAGAGAKVEAYDPIANARVPVEIERAGAHDITLELTAADYPYLLTVQEP